MRKLCHAAVAIVAVLSTFGCGSDPKQQVGDLEFSISGPATSQAAGISTLALSDSCTEPGCDTNNTDNEREIESVWLCILKKVHGVDFPLACEWERIGHSGVQFPITLKKTKLLAGEYIVAAVATTSRIPWYWDEDVLYKSEVEVTVADREVTTVRLIMQQVAAPDTVGVVAPQISGITASTNLPAIGRPVHLQAFVNSTPDPKFKWEVSCAGDFALGAFSAPHATETDLTLWRCESNATVTFTMEDDCATGSGGSMYARVTFTLPYVEQGIDASIIDINSFPNIVYIRATNDVEPAAGETVNLVAKVSDPDGDPMTYEWSFLDAGSSSCGNFAPLSGAVPADGVIDTVWTAPGPGEECYLSLTVKEAGEEGHDEGVNSGWIFVLVEPTMSLP
jgi:hypothetical protein